ncbi:MAG: sulfur carrier protein ThiS [Chitinophagales bacterium]
MKLKVNSQLLEIENESLLLSLIRKLMLEEKSGIAVAVNAEVIQKKNWSQFELRENDEVVIIEAAQGG